MADMTIAGLTGSLREGAFTRQMMDTLVDLAPSGMTVELIEIGHLPFYNADLRDGDHGPAEVRAFAEKIAQADGLIVGSPEYNRSFPAVIKNAIDWLSKEPGAPLAGKPTLIATQSPGQLGGISANYHLRQVLSIAGAVFVTGGEVAITGIGGKVEGGRITDADTRKYLSSHLDKLADLIGRHR
ncbi:NADPH-dependent FMN reductase [Pseudooceanicola onchidii]|uniref:NADPH-dependent FMN reductase n=1 Tax=Pseudooceanicola onchidii TaxID=2562279 RepID=UPI0010AA51BA|nr:NADPH-dependent FMN reductase [Pseudooceanicola onchidii]